MLFGVCSDGFPISCRQSRILLIFIINHTEYDQKDKSKIQTTDSLSDKMVHPFRVHVSLDMLQNKYCYDVMSWKDNTLTSIQSSPMPNTLKMEKLINCHSRVIVVYLSNISLVTLLITLQCSSFNTLHWTQIFYCIMLMARRCSFILRLIPVDELLDCWYCSWDSSCLV